MNLRMRILDLAIIVAALLLLAFTTRETDDATADAASRTGDALADNIRTGIYAEPVCELCGRPCAACRCDP